MGTCFVPKEPSTEPSTSCAGKKEKDEPFSQARDSNLCCPFPIRQHCRAKEFTEVPLFAKQARLPQSPACDHQRADLLTSCCEIWASQGSYSSACPKPGSGIPVTWAPSTDSEKDREGSAGSGILSNPAVGARGLFWSLSYQVSSLPEWPYCWASGAHYSPVHIQPRENSFKQDPPVRNSLLGLPRGQKPMKVMIPKKPS